MTTWKLDPPERGPVWALTGGLWHKFERMSDPPVVLWRPWGSIGLGVPFERIVAEYDEVTDVDPDPDATRADRQLRAVQGELDDVLSEVHRALHGATLTDRDVAWRQLRERIDGEVPF